MSDLFGHLTQIAARLTSQVPTVRTYYGSQIVGANSDPVKSGIFVAPGEAALIDNSLWPRAGAAAERHIWKVVVRASMDTGAAAALRVEHVLGTLAYSVINALEGYELTTGTATRLKYLGHDEMGYDVAAGYAEMVLKFSADMAIS